jgi:hypothetical protein
LLSDGEAQTRAEAARTMVARLKIMTNVDEWRRMCAVDGSGASAVALYTFRSPAAPLPSWGSETWDVRSSVLAEGRRQPFGALSNLPPLI